MENGKGRTMAEIAADILDLGPFLPGTVRRDFRKHVGKDGRGRQYEVQPRVNLRVGGRRVDKRIPKGAFAQVKRLTENYARFRALVAELEEPAAREHLPGGKKKPERRGGPAGGRNANVVCAGRYAYAGRDGSPLFLRDPIRYHVTGAGGAALGEETWRIAEQEGVDRVRRVVFFSDGENELEAVFQEHFAALPNVTRVLDAMHACQYVDALCKDLDKNPARAAKASHRLRRRLVNAGWEGFAKSFARRFGADAPDRMGEDGRKAWKYLSARKTQMDYARFRRRHIPIGSGMAEAGCKLNLGRLKGPGMHWRFDNGIKIALLRATLRSGMVITA